MKNLKEGLVILTIMVLEIQVSDSLKSNRSQQSLSSKTQTDYLKQQATNGKNKQCFMDYLQIIFDVCHRYSQFPLFLDQRLKEQDDGSSNLKQDGLDYYIKNIQISQFENKTYQQLVSLNDRISVNILKLAKDETKSELQESKMFKTITFTISVMLMTIAVLIIAIAVTSFLRLQMSILEKCVFYQRQDQQPNDLSKIYKV